MHDGDELTARRWSPIDRSARRIGLRQEPMWRPTPNHRSNASSAPRTPGGNDREGDEQQTRSRELPLALTGSVRWNRLVVIRVVERRLEEGFVSCSAPAHGSMLPVHPLTSSPTRTTLGSISHSTRERELHSRVHRNQRFDGVE
ncbi:hypothetical protein EA462_14220 [Natrarchaeobius halalkaliphilus]|uniref:Uncharacterized protein n=1 Tax=Natrarchaeobius halalkaliphilus TaxID=1679091 RepID=A0A3N6M5J9_9EURY|nr:hypothetical protein EA462_14220 [Natrarchaeobius halalkaliphilus]